MWTLELEQHDDQHRETGLGMVGWAVRPVLGLGAVGLECDTAG